MTLLLEVGIAVPTDEGEALQLLDPFSFVALLVQYRDRRLAGLLVRVGERLGLDTPPPTDFTGLPWSMGVSPVLFAYGSERQPEDLPTLWALAQQAVIGSVSDTTFARALKIKGVALSKLTQGLFWLNPDHYLPLNSVNVPYLKTRGVRDADRVQTLVEYMSVLSKAIGLAPSFLELSQQAWLEGQRTAGVALDGPAFPFSQFKEEAARFETDREKGNMLLDGRYAPLLLDVLGEEPGTHLKAERHPYSGSTQLAVKVSLGGVEGRWYARALLLPEAGSSYHALSAGLTLEAALSDGRGEQVREVLRASAERERLVDVLVTGSAFHSPPLLVLNSDFGRVALLPVTPEQRSEVLETIHTYAQGFGKSRRLQVGVTLSPEELESEAFPEHLTAALAYIDRVAGVLDDLNRRGEAREDAQPLPPMIGGQEPELPEALPIRAPLNQILYGPPGTGKTYQVVDEALSILDPAFLGAHPGAEGRQARKARYDELAAAGRVTFVTFHQSFGYEDFIEGIKPVMEGGQLRYELEDGLFLQAVRAAGGGLEGESPAPAPPTEVNLAGQVWRLYIDGAAQASQVRERSVARNELRIGSWLPGSVTLDGRPPAVLKRPADLTTLPEDQLNGQQHAFKDSVRTGDVVLLATGQNRIGAVGVVTGEYRFDPHSDPVFAPDYAHARPVRWLATGLQWSAQELTGKVFAQQTLQRVLGVTPEGVLRALPNLQVKSRATSSRPHVLIIDEINRGNVAKVFGELITLLEPSKRAGAGEALTVTLPLSKRRLSVPSGLYVIGTMNTADRSLTQLDAALRRRFVFRPVWPQPEVLPVLELDGVALDLRKFLYAINDRIEQLLSREQVIGHAYLLGLPATLEGVASALRERILPLLEEYFFEDWAKIREVLGDEDKPEALQFIGQRQVGQGVRYFPNRAADSNVEAFVRVYSGVNDTDFPFA